jgi:hypothetical protein
MGGHNMSRLPVWASAVGLVLLAGGLKADDSNAALEKQRQAAKENWERVEAGPLAQMETMHLILLAPKDQEKRLMDLGSQLEKFYTAAAGTLYGKDAPWEGKMAVYLFGNPETFDSFLRRVAKRRVRGMQQGSFSAEEDKPRAAACPPREKGAPSVEVQAGRQVAVALLMRKAGTRTPVPFWLVSGFGRATGYRASGPARPEVTADRRAALRHVLKNKRSASDVWSGALEGEEAILLSASLADFLAYGPGKAKFAALLEGFKPDGNGRPKSAEQALESAGLKADAVNQTWRRWLPLAR